MSLRLPMKLKIDTGRVFTSSSTSYHTFLDQLWPSPVAYPPFELATPRHREFHLLLGFAHRRILAYENQTLAALEVKTSGQASGDAEIRNEKLPNTLDLDPESGTGTGAFTTKDKQEAESSQAANTSPTKAKGRSCNPFEHTYHWIRRTYCPIEEAPLVLPTAPTDAEKYSYLHTNRIPLYIFGILSFLSLGAGMWLFALCDKTFYWYGAFVGFLNIYLLISYFVGVVGKDWDYGAHKQRVERYPITEETAPTIDVFLPVCSEELEILGNTWRHVTQLDWPASRIKVHVLDDGAKDTVRRLAEEYRFNYIVRGDRPRLKKAGNLRWAFSRTDGDFFVIFDADFCPRQDFIREMVVEQLDDERVAIVQSPQFFRVTDEQTWVEQGAGATQELFYRVVQVNRDRWGASICVGSNAMYRRAALEEVGGTAEIGFSEDVHTG